MCIKPTSHVLLHRDLHASHEVAYLFPGGAAISALQVCYLYMCICVYVYVCMCVYVYMYMCICVCVCV
jgi:hypothetical protein